MTADPGKSRAWRARHILAAVALAASSGQASAEDAWDLFTRTEPRAAVKSREATKPAPPAPIDDRPMLSPMDGRVPRPGATGAAPAADGAVPADASQRYPAANSEPLPPLAVKRGAIERDELAPVIASDGSGLPYEFWRGLDVAAVERLFAALDIPPRSPALAALWRRLIVSDVRPDASGEADERFAALRVEALSRSGLIKDAGDAVAKLPGGKGNALAAILTARIEIALGRSETACEAIRAAPAGASVPAALKSEAILISGYCAVKGGNAAAGGLSADLLREHGAEPSAGMAALDAMASGTTPDLRGIKRISAVDYRLLELAGGFDFATVIDRSSPAVLVAVAQDANVEPRHRIMAGEAALQVNAFGAGDLAAVYRLHPRDGGVAPAGGAAARPIDALRRAELFKAADSERTPLKKVRLIRSFLDDSRRAGLYLAALEMAAPMAATVQPVAELGWFAETAIEVALAAGDFEKARSWARFGAGADLAQSGAARGPLDHWLALADIADHAMSGGRGATLASVEDLALRGRFGSDVLHRLATVLDSLDYHVPIPLWDAASRAPQPAGGHLPATGVLTELLDASKKKEFGRTVLIAMQALGPNGAEGAHLIALGDSIRALKRAGLEPDARRLAFEALFASWPRSAAY